MKANKQEALQILEIIKALAEGKTIQYKSTRSGEWNDYLPQDILDIESCIREPLTRRIKPEVKLRAWRAKEIPVGKALIRFKNGEHCDNFICGDHCRHLIISSAKEMIAFFMGGSIKTIYFQDAFEKCEHSIDGGENWIPCGIAEQ